MIQSTQCSNFTQNCTDLPLGNTTEDDGLDDDDDEQTVSLMRLEATDLRVNPNYIKYYLIYCNFLINSLVPFVLLIILNFFIYKTVKTEIHENIL